MRYSDPEMFVRLATADADALAVEYIRLPRDRVVFDRSLLFLGYEIHPTHQHKPGVYSDDTEMSVANARVLIEEHPPYTPLMFANAWVREFQRGGRRKGYSRGFQVLLEKVTSGTELLEAIHPNSDKNGACMRAVPFGVLRTVAEVLEVSTLQARITHDTPEGRFSARAVALMSHFALYESGSFSALSKYCFQHLPKEDLDRFGYVFRHRWSGVPVTRKPHASVAITTVHAAVDLLMHGTSLMQMLEQVIRWGGDTDSVAAIVWGIASPRFSNKGLPSFLERDLEGGNPRTGTPYLLEIGTNLMKKFGE
jgi:ADP-ribosylglycohydrolase